MIRIELAQERVRNGERVTGRAVWSSGGDPAQSIEVVCGWRIEGRVKRRETIIGRVDADASARTEVVLPFEFEIPIAGPLSYEGKLFRITWEVDAGAGRDVESQPFTVAPRKWDPKEWVEVEDEDTPSP
ncbi:MAG: hypothetical protein AABO58_04935 [Acidobacteriota bacterium]